MPQIFDIKVFNKGMNKDVDPRFLQDGEYVNAQNIMLSNYREGRVGGVTNFPGLNPRVSVSTVLGLFNDELNDLLYYFEYVSAGSKRIRTYNLVSGAQTTLLDTSVLPWTSSTIIKAARIIEGIIVWTDGANEIGMFDTNITYPTPYVAEMFTLAQTVPHNRPEINPEIDGDYGYNNIIGKFFQFKYRFVFLTGHKSVFSPISEVAYTNEDYASPEKVAEKTALVNSIRVTLDGTGATEMVDKIEIAARSGNNGDFFSIGEVDATGTFQAGGTQDFVFYNESLYDPIALEESNQIYDDVPQLANALEVIDNRIVLGDILTGYDKVAVDYDLEVEYIDQTDPAPDRFDSDFDYYDVDPVTYPSTRYGFNNSTEFSAMMTARYGAPVAGNIVTVSGKSDDSGGVPVDYSYPFGWASYEIQTGDTWANQVWTALTTPTFYQPYPNVYLDLHDISTNNAPPPTGNDAFVYTYSEKQHEKTFKSGAWYSVGIQYFDKYGRTNGVQYKENSRIYIKTLGERGLTQDSYVGAGAARIKVTINSYPPSWAAYYKIVYSRATVNEFVLQIATKGCTTVSGTQNVLLNIGTIADWNDAKGGNLAYIWEKGDRIKILTYNQGGTDIYKDWAQSLIDAEIIGDDSSGDYSIIIPKISSLSQAASATALNTGAVIEIYRPSKQLDASDSIFIEATPSYEVSGGYHLGDVNQTAVVDGEVTITGDAYIKSREDFPYGTGSSTAGIGFESYDISDYRDSEHYDKGRPTAIINQEQSQKVATLMYSEFIIPNTDINNLNRFYPDVNFEEYEKIFGRIKVLHSEEDHLLMIQEDRASKVYTNRQMMYDGQGNGQLIGTQRTVLSQAVPYAGIYGIHDWRSFQAIGNRRYWMDAARGVVLRLSQNGIEEISRYGMRGYFAEQSYDLMNSSNTVVRSAYDVQNDQYLIHLDGEDVTLVFDEKNNSWVSFVTFIKPEHSTYINNKSFVVQNSYICELNDYTNKNASTDSAAASFIEFSSNIEPAELKNFLAIHLDGSHALEVDVLIEAIGGGTAQVSTLELTDFTQREQEWHASFLRDANTPNVTYPLLEGDTLKGKNARITLTLPASVGDEDFSMKLVKVVVSKG